MKPTAHWSACSGVNIAVLAHTFDKNIWECTRIKPYRTRVHQANTTFSLSAYLPFLSIAFYYHSLPEFHSIIHVITILPLSINFLLNFGPVPTVWHCFCSFYDQFICLSWTQYVIRYCEKLYMTLLRKLTIITW
jgi:hypothetical protein